MKKTFLFFSCSHHPLQDDDAIVWLLQHIHDRKPDVVIHGGDGHESRAASVWPGEEEHTLADEFREHNEFLGKLLDASPGSEFVFLEGNHDANILAENRIDRGLRQLCDYRLHEPNLKHFRIIPYDYSKRGVYRLGQVTFAHGYEAGGSAEKFQAVLLGQPYGLFCCGHTHRPKHVQQAHITQTVPLPYWFANPGCMRTMDCDFMSRKRQHSWGQGIVVGEAKITKSPRLKPDWDAQTIIKRMYAEELYK